MISNSKSIGALDRGRLLKSEMEKVSEKHKTCTRSRDSENRMRYSGTHALKRTQRLVSCSSTHFVILCGGARCYSD